MSISGAERRVEAPGYRPTAARLLVLPLGSGSDAVDGSGWIDVDAGADGDGALVRGERARTVLNWV